jgi:hypothetical protein
MPKDCPVSVPATSSATIADRQHWSQRLAQTFLPIDVAAIRSAHGAAAIAGNIPASRDLHTSEAHQLMRVNTDRKTRP